MDGYAVFAADLALASAENPVSLKVSRILSAGDDAQHKHNRGEATRIMTGAALPEGADAIVPQEDVSLVDSRAVFKEPTKPGQFVRFVGEDLPAGATVLDRGERLRSGALGTLASTGAVKVAVAKRPRVVLIASGNELAEIGTDLAPGQIYNSNLYTLQAQVEEAGGEVIRCLTVSDDRESVRTALSSCQDIDVIVTSGGVSVGDKDYIRPVVEEIGQLIFWQAAIRPGKPISLGKIGTSLVLALPGNPASSYVTFELFGRPLLLKMQGASTTTRRVIPATVADEIRHEPGRRSFVRVYLSLSGSNILATTTGPQSSGMVTSTAFADGLLVLPEEQASFRPGARASVILLD